MVLGLCLLVFVFTSTSMVYAAQWIYIPSPAIAPPPILITYPTASIVSSAPSHYGIYGAISVNYVDPRQPIMWNWILYEDGRILNGGISGILGYGSGTYPFQCTTSVFVQPGDYQCIFSMSLEIGTTGSNANPITLYSPVYAVT